MAQFHAMAYLKQLADVHLCTPEHLSSLILFKYRSCVTASTTILNLKFSLSYQLCPQFGLRKHWSYVLYCKAKAY